MNKIKVFFAVLALGFSLSSFAMTDDESVEFSSALTDGKLKIVEKYIKAEPAAINDKLFGWTPIQIAANHNQIAVVKYLLSKGAEIDYMHPYAHHTAFMLAALNGNEEMMKLLASSGADVNVKLKGDVSLIRYFRDEGNTHMVELLTSLGAKDDGCKEKQCF
jgi:uncharacterized protein